MTISLKKSCDRGEIFMTKWPVDGSVADRPEGVLQNERDNLGWPGGGVFEVREEFCFLRIAFMVMCHRTV